MSGTVTMTGIDIHSAGEIKLHRILTASSTAPSANSMNFRIWVLKQFSQREQNECDCSLENFALYFLNGVRSQTYQHLRGLEASEYQCPKSDKVELKKKPPRNYKSESFDSSLRETQTGLQMQHGNFPALEVPSKHSFSQLRNSTPTRKSLNQKQCSQNTRRSTDNGNKSFGATSNNSSFEKSRNSTGDGSFCLGDFILSPSVSNRHSSGHKKKAQSNTTLTPNINSTSKPKKRVVPISVSKPNALTAQDSGPFGANSSFSHENNILTLSPTEIKEFNKRAVAEARKALKNDLSEVCSVIKASTPASTPTKAHTSLTYVSQSEIKLEPACSQIAHLGVESSALELHTFNKIPNNTSDQLKILASIYGLLIDLNLTTNILHELSFLLNLLNANVAAIPANKELLPKSDEDKTSEAESSNSLQLLKESINSVYFAKCVLEEQQHTLALIDFKSLGVILQCERLVCLLPSLKTDLTLIYEQKQVFSTAATYDISLSGSKNVYFQEDSDSRKFFNTNNDFGAFKTQRDLFYSALKIWEKHHLYPTWNFTEVAPKVRDIFRQSENPVNMTHFAKLFVSQLLISATERTSPEEVGIGMDDVNLEKFNKLSQRLIAPSDFSVDYQFPREQAFFRDFIVESRSVPFFEHLKIVLFSELVSLNDSTFERINLLAEDGYRECNKENEFIVKPSVLSSMLILAKFLGFVTALPFQDSRHSEAQSAIIQSHQLQLRRLFPPPVNICNLLEVALKNGRHLITLPWIVQYLAMLDDITLQLDNLVETKQKLYDLYTALGNGEINCTPTSGFIVRCCIGWLFQQMPMIANEYINYRIMQNNNIKIRLHFKPENKVVNVDLQIKPILESILCVACPFLAEFRVSIMPAKHTMAKYVSRSGRFRHITPCVAMPERLCEPQVNLPTPSANNTINSKSESTLQCTSKEKQTMLMENFLHAQNSSMQRLIVFLSERVYKCVIRDAQIKILLPLKAAADNQVNEITSSDKATVLEQIKEIYQNARSETRQQWDIDIPKMLTERTERGLEILLPIETAPIIKKAYAMRIRITAKSKIQQWCQTNVYNNDFYCNNLQELTAKICKVNANRTKKSANQTTELKLIRSQPRISEFLEEMQLWLYTTGFQTAFQSETWSTEGANIQGMHGLPTPSDLALINFLERLKSSFENTLPTIYYRLIGAGLVQLLQHFISNAPILLTNDLIQSACQFFSSDKIITADVPPTPTKENKAKTDMEDEENRDLNSSINAPTTTTTTIYHALITAPFIASLGTCEIRYNKLKSLLCALIEHGIITLDFVNELFVIVFKEDLGSSVFNAVSTMLYELVQKSSELTTAGKDACNSESDDDDNGDNDVKSRLLMEVLADFSRDLDDF